MHNGGSDSVSERVNATHTHMHVQLFQFHILLSLQLFFILYLIHWLKHRIMCAFARSQLVLVLECVSLVTLTSFKLPLGNRPRASSW